MHIIQRLDIQLVNSCNLTCRGCISLSDFTRKGIYTVESLKQDCMAWSKKINPKIITLFGGEPLLHANLFDCIDIIRTYWPSSILRLITNGLLLDRYNNADWYNINQFEMQISYHRTQDRKKINQLVKSICQLSKWKMSESNQPHVFKILKNQTQHFKILLCHFREFVPPYNYKSGKVTPCYSDPTRAHNICGSPNTPVLLDGKLYKCPPVGNLINILGGWLNYQGLSPDDNIQEFVSNIGSAESVCSGCPDNLESAFDHFDMNNIPKIKAKLL